MNQQLAAAVILALSGALSLLACDRSSVSRKYHLDSLPALVATVEQRFGSSDNPDIGFTNIGGLDTDRDGNLYVLDASDREIRVYTPDFRMIRTIGRAGSGPGEFEGWPWFGVIGDTVWTIDDPRGRITLFSRKGEIISTGSTPGLRISLPDAYGYVRPRSMRPDGRFTAALNMITGLRGDAPTGVKPTDSIPVPRVIFDASGAIADTIGWDEKPPPRMWRAPGTYNEEGMWRTMRVDNRPYLVPDPPTEMPSWFALHDGRIIVESHQPASGADTMFTVTRLSLSRDTVYHTAVYYSPVRYEASELDAIAASASHGVMMVMTAAGGASRPEPDPAVARLLREAMRFPEYKMPFRSQLLVGPNENVWLLRSDGAGAMAQWILFNADGEPEGQLELSARARVLWRNGDVLWTAEPDPMDVPWLVRYRIGHH